MKKLIEQSDSRLVYQEEPLHWLGFLFVLPFFCGFVIGPAFFICFLVWMTGEYNLNCDRIEPTIVECEVSNSRLFGLVKKQPKPIGVIKEAMVVRETRTDSEGDDYDVDVLYGLDSQGSKIALPLDRNVYDNAAQINLFIASPSQSTLTLTQDLSLGEILRILAGMAFLMVFIVIGWKLLVPALIDILRLKLSQLELDQSQGYLRLQNVYKHRSPKVLEQIPLAEITSIDLEEEKDSDGDSIYKVVVNSSQRKALVLERESSREPIATMVAELQAFLGLPSQSEQGQIVGDLSVVGQEVQERSESFEPIAISPDQSTPSLEGSRNGDSLTFPIPNDGGDLEFIWVPAGTLVMTWRGDLFWRNKKTHKVTFQSGFWMGKYPVTQRQYQAVMGKNPSDFQGDLDHPVENVNWQDAIVFCQELSKILKQTIDLPSETQWEWAARGTTKSQGFEYAGSNNLDEVGWHGHNSGGKTHPVGQKKPNELGLYDMSGNVWEWCKDKWTGSSNELPRDGTPFNGGSSTFHAFRGGAWFYGSGGCAVSYRNLNHSGNYSVGFRVVLL